MVPPHIRGNDSLYSPRYVLSCIGIMSDTLKVYLSQGSKNGGPIALCVGDFSHRHHHLTPDIAINLFTIYHINHRVKSIIKFLNFAV